jgi:GNAT superfamily N-acetyltransferase
MSIIRKASLGDDDQIASLSGELGYPCTPAQIDHRLSVILPLKHHSVFVAETSDGKVIGWIHVFISFRVESDPFVEIGGLVVSQSHRGQGIGELLFGQAVGWTRDQQLNVIRVRSRIERDDAHRFYKRLGFRQLKSQYVYIVDL